MTDKSFGIFEALRALEVVCEGQRGRRSYSRTSHVPCQVGPDGLDSLDVAVVHADLAGRVRAICGAADARQRSVELEHGLIELLRIADDASEQHGLRRSASASEIVDLTCCSSYGFSMCERLAWSTGAVSARRRTTSRARKDRTAHLFQALAAVASRGDVSIGTSTPASQGYDAQRRVQRVKEAGERRLGTPRESTPAWTRSPLGGSERVRIERRA